MSGPGRSRTPLAAFLVAEAIAMAGNKTSMLALPWLVLTTTGSATWTGVVAFAQTGSYVLVKAFGAPLIDRVGRRRCVLGAGAVGAVLIAVVPVLWHVSGPSSVALVVVVAPLGAVQSVGDSSKRLLIPDLVAATGSTTERVTSLYAAVERLSYLLGAPIAGVLIAAIGAADVLIVDALCLAASSAILAVLVPVGRATSPGSSTGDGYVAALRAGYRYVARDRFLLCVCGLLFAANLMDQASAAVFVPVWTSEVVGDAAALGAVAGLFGAGAVVGSALFAWLGPRTSRFGIFSVGFLLAGSPPLFVMAAGGSLVAVLVVHFVAGILTAAMNPIITSAMFERVPSDMRARVFGATGAVAWLGVPLGGLLGGVAVDALGRTGGMLLAGVVYLLVTVTPFALPSLRSGMDGPVRTDTVREPSAA